MTGLRRDSERRRATDRCLELVVIDRAVPDRNAVRQAAIGRGAQVLVLEPEGDGLEQIAGRLVGCRGLAALHVVGHGRDGAITLAGAELDDAAMERRAGSLGRIGAALAPGGALLLYGCDVAASERGRGFVARLAALTGAAVAAAIGPTGAADLGGDWALAHRHGRVAAKPLAVPAMAGLLATFTVTNLNDSGAGSLRQAITDANASAGADTIVFQGGVTGTIYVGDFLPTVTESVTITGPGRANLTVDGSGGNQWDLSDGNNGVLQNISISGITIKGLDLRVYENFTLNDVRITENSVNTLYQRYGTLSISNSTIDNNTNFVWFNGSDTSASFTNVTFNNPSADLNVHLKGPLTVTGTTFGATTSENISGTGSLTKTGTDTLVLSGVSSYSGTTTVSQGTLSIAADNNLGTGAVTVTGGSTLAITGATTIDNAMTFSGAGGALSLSAAVTLSGAISGTGSMSLTGAQTLTLSGTNTSFSGGMTIGPGSTLSAAAGSSLGTGSITLTGSTLAVTGATTVSNNLNLDFGFAATVSAAADVTLSGVLSNAGNLVKTGTGTLTLSGTNTFLGTTTVSAGTLKLTGGSALPDSRDVTVSAGATLDVNGATETVGPISGAGTVSVGTGNLTVTQSFDGSFSGVISGTGSLTKTGTGVLTLSGSNTFSGTTTVSAGTLKLSGGNAIADGATVNVAAGATLDLNGSNETIGALTGSGTVTTGAGSLTLTNAGASSFTGTLSGTGTFSIASGVTLKGTGTYTTPIEVLSGATIAPGNSPGVISTGNLTLASGSTASMEINGTTAGTGHDQIAVTGTVTINSATLTTSFGYTSTTGDSFVLIKNDGVDAVTGTFSGLAEGATIVTAGRSYRISYAGSDGNDVTLTDIGEAPIPGFDGGAVGGAPTAQYLVGGAGNETFFGSDGADTVSALAGDDQVYAGAGADLAYGNQGNDSLWGNADADSLFGGQDGDLVYGNQGSDLLYGNLGTDTLYGGQDADTAYGGQDADILYGNLGDDRLFGGLGDDVIYGGQGADTISGGAGNDLLVGGLGADRIAIGSGDGVDTVSGFSTSDGDVIAVAADVNGTGIATAADLLTRLSSDADGNAVLDLGSGNTLTLMGVRTSELSAADFLIA